MPVKSPEPQNATPFLTRPLVGAFFVSALLLPSVTTVQGLVCTPHKDALGEFRRGPYGPLSTKCCPLRGHDGNDH